MSTDLLPSGARLRPLNPAPDERGMFGEIFRAEWTDGEAAIQWSVTRSRAGVMRGVRVHPRHHDYLVVLDGTLIVGLRDLRRNSPTRDSVSLTELKASALSLLAIPPGVAHGLYSPEPVLFVLGVTRYYDPEDEIACRWDDPALGIPWPVSAAVVSEGDARGLSLAEATERVARSE
jgi:dTDP-4-dehydrorhamnose 3,5-epimerase